MKSRNRDRVAGEMLGILVGGEWVVRPPAIEVRNPFDGCLAGAVSTGGAADVQNATTRAFAALATDLPSHARWHLLSKTAEHVEAQAEDYAWEIAREGSKTIREARREVLRSANILRLCAEEARRLRGETLPFDTREGSENRVVYYFLCRWGLSGRSRRSMISRMVQKLDLLEFALAFHRTP